MKTINYFAAGCLFASILTFLSGQFVFGQSLNTVRLRGELYSDQRALMQDKPEWVWNENRLDLRLESVTDRVKVYGNVWVRYLGQTALHGSGQLQHKEKINPWNLDIREAYVEVSRFIFDRLDLKVGRQRIAWGTADRFNPTDNLNPYDLEDLFDFGRYNGSDAINLLWHFGHSSSLQAVYMPFFRPANLPVGYFADLFHPAVSLPEYLTLNAISDQLLMPPSTLYEQASGGARFRGFAFNTDFSFSYLYGRDVLPMATLARITPVDNIAGTSCSMTSAIDVYAELVYPRHHIWGMDLAGAIGPVGVWAEAAMILPEKAVLLVTDLSALMPPESPLPGTLTTTQLRKQAYVKYVVGADYTFRNGTYLNMQYLHGFFHEKGRENLNDYLLMGLEKSLWQNKLLIRPLAGGVSVTDWKDMGNNYAIFFTPEVSYTGIDNLSVKLGAFLFSGKGDELFARLHGNNLISLQVIAYF